MYPTEVKVNEEAIARLVNTYKRAYKEIVKELEGATDFGVYHRKALLKQIEGTLEALGENTQEFLEKELPKYYVSGANDAVTQMKAIDAPLRVSKGFSRIHKEAIAALVDDSAKAFAEALTGVNRNANVMLNKAVREEMTQRLATGQIKGEALKKTKQTIIAQIKDQGIDALKSKAYTTKNGVVVRQTWTLDRYSEMLIRTKAVEARNRGFGNRMVENGYDLVQVSRHFSTHEACRVWEGKILSMTGANKAFPTVQKAEEEGLFHPNCKHAINALHMDLARETMAWDSESGRYTKGLLVAK